MLGRRGNLRDKGLTRVGSHRDYGHIARDFKDPVTSKRGREKNAYESIWEEEGGRGGSLTSGEGFRCYSLKQQRT